ncbi:unnamed protein product [Rotaria sp. Silwood1]|nr:unnamed protein product [Rotaria sp. Silwood1]
MIQLLRLSLRTRLLLERPKTISPPITAYDNQQECQSLNELDGIQNNNDRLYVEALLIRERILLPQKSENLFPPLLKRAIVLAELAEFDRCLNLLLHTFYLYQQMELRTSLHRFVWIFCRMLDVKVPINADRFLDVGRLVFEPSQQTTKEDNIVNSVLEQSTISGRDRHSIIQWIKDLCREQRRTENGRTLLHLSVDIETYWSINYRAVDIMHILIFPNLAATRLLVCYGRRWIDLDAVDLVQSDTALHRISQSWVFSNNKDKKAIVELLINAGAHIDCVNAHGHRPVDVATGDEIRTLLRSKQILPRLKCLCASVVTNQQIMYDDLWPTSTPMNTFIRLHGGLKRKRSMSDCSISSFDVYDDMF